MRFEIEQENPQLKFKNPYYTLWKCEDDIILDSLEEMTKEDLRELKKLLTNFLKSDIIKA